MLNKTNIKTTLLQKKADYLKTLDPFFRHRFILINVDDYNNEKFDIFNFLQVFLNFHSKLS